MNSPIPVTVAFSCTVVGVQFSHAIQFNDTLPIYKNITLLPEVVGFYDKYLVHVRKQVNREYMTTVRAVIAEAHLEVREWSWCFSLAANIAIKDLQCLGYLDPGGHLSTYDSIFGNKMAVKTSAIGTLVAGPTRIQMIKDALNSGYDQDKAREWFECTSIQDPIGRFISLYTLLLHHFSDSQKQVDEEILKVDSTVAQFRSPIGPHYETVFTKLRNELSHKRKAN